MKAKISIKYSFLILVIAFLFSSIETFGQYYSGNCHGDSYYYADNDGDFHGTNNYSSNDEYIALSKKRNSGNKFETHGNVGYGCYQGRGWVTSNDDCDDTNPLVYQMSTWYYDGDRDGAGNPNAQQFCGRPAGSYSRFGGDNCDSTPGVSNPSNWYLDADGDGEAGSSISASFSCDPPPAPPSPGKYVSSPGNDCDDNDASVKSQSTWYLDADGDGVAGSSSQAESFCGLPPVPPSPAQYLSSPGNDNCDSVHGVSNPSNWYLDADGDNEAGSSSQAISSCGPPSATSPAQYLSSPGNDDCDSVHGVSNPSNWYYDDDNDGTGGPSGLQNCVRPGVKYVLTTGDNCDSTHGVYDPSNWYLDDDGDGTGGSVSQNSCEPSSGYVSSSGDDCDNVYGVYSPSTWYLDKDGDGFGITSSALRQCATPTKPAVGNYVSKHGDRDDSTKYITNIPPMYYYKDIDGDNYGDPKISLYYSHPPKHFDPSITVSYVLDNTDCDDTDKLIHSKTVWYIDQDGDGLGYNPSLLSTTNSLRNTPNLHIPSSSVVTMVIGCSPPSSTTSYVLNNKDYDDSELLITTRPLYFYQDLDQDTFGNPNVFLFQSNKPVGYVPDNTDCNDNEITINPRTVWYPDVDGDGFGSKLVSVTGCVPPSSSSHVTNTLDFDDSTVNIIDIPPKNYYQDLDRDTYGNPSVFLYYSSKPVGYVEDNTDCNDNEITINPNTVWYPDIDGDGFGSKLVSVTGCVPPTSSNHVTNSFDFDDGTVNITNIPPKNYYQDLDNDTYGNP